MTCWNQQSVSPKQVVGFTCVFNFEVDKLVRKLTVFVWEYCIADRSSGVGIGVDVSIGVVVVVVVILSWDRGGKKSLTF